MGVEIEGGDTAELLQFGGITKEIFELSKNRYTRAFLLSCAELDICKKLPSGFQLEPSVLCQLMDIPRSTPESWRGSEALSVNSSDGNSKCSSMKSGSRWNNPSLKLNNKSSLEKIYDAETRRQDAFLQCPPKAPERKAAELRRQDSILHCPPKAPGCKDAEFSKQDGLLHYPPKAAGCEAEILAQNIEKKQNNDFYQLRKSENPYRPPHCYKVGSSNFEAKSISVNINSVEEIHFTNEIETQPKAQAISSDEDHEIQIFSAPLIASSSMAKDTSSSGSVDVVKPSDHACNSLEDFVACEDEIRDFGWCNISASMNREEFNQEHSRTSLKEHVGSSFKVNNISSSTVIENAMPQHVAANLGSEMGHSRYLCMNKMGGLNGLLMNSSESNSVNSKMRKDHKTTSDLELNELCCSRKSDSGQRVSVDRITRTDFAKPCESPFRPAYGFLTSSAGDCNSTRLHQKSTMAAYVAEDPELHKMDDDESSFEDVWSEILAIIHFEKDMELTPVAEYGETADSEVQMCLPDEDGLIAIAYPSGCELSKENNFDDSADSDAEFHLPDENNLICIDDLISPHCLRLIDDETSVKTDKVAKEPGTLDINCDKKRPALQGLAVSPVHDVTSSVGHRGLQSQPSYPWNLCTGINAEIPSLHPFDSQQTQMRLPVPLLDPVAPHTCSASHCYSCTNMHHQPSKMEFDFLVQYTVLQQPINFPRQNHELQINVGPFDPPIKELAGYTRGLDRIETAPWAYQQSTYPNLAIPDLAMLLAPPGVGGFNHQSSWHRFVDMGRGLRRTRNSAAAWHGKNPPREHLS